VAPSPARRRVATVLFVDIVGSTALASELGDASWRLVLKRFRAVVRSELKRMRGREQDTAGDGFYATFAEPARALSAAASIVAAVQDLGLDLRVGVHTGECEEVDGKLTGVAVHIGARVMALAAAAEVLATRTTRDLVVGSNTAFEEAGTHALKGVEGEWLLYRLLSVSERLPAPLEPAVAAERLAGVLHGGHGRRRWPLVAGAAAIAAAALAIGGFAAFGGNGRHAGIASLLRIDPASNRVVATVRDAQIGCGCGANLWAVDGTLWERGGSDSRTLAVRTLSSGALRRTFRLPADATAFTIGDGSIWIGRNRYVQSGAQEGTPFSEVERIDELSGRRTARIRLPGDFAQGSLAVAGGVLWVLEGDSILVRIDPATARITGRFDPGAIETSTLIPADGYLWICECIDHEVLRFDPRTKTSKTFHFTQQPWHLVAVPGRKRPTLWLLDSYDATITRLNAASGGAGAPLGLAGEPTEAVLAHGSIWIAAGKVVDRVRLSNGSRSTIKLPKGTHATGIAVDPATGAIWVDNSRTEPRA
jgi:class 3 adenylate cyclase/streptogramin lyase